MDIVPCWQDSLYELVHESPVSAIYLMRGIYTELRAVKISTANRRFVKEPHDINKEIRILLQLSHPNIISLLGHDIYDTNYRLFMPYIPCSLKFMLAHTSFTPCPYYASEFSGIQESRFLLLVKSISFQILQALEYLHHQSPMIAHRDIKPENILLTEDCQVKLIDFGIAWEHPDIVAGGNKIGDFWLELPDNMYTEVATGPYRAPELLFGPKSYDAFATDIWSLGATLAEFFTPLRLEKTDDNDSDYSDDEGSTRESQGIYPPAFVIPRTLSQEEQSWHRASIFNAEMGEIGLAWSIFKVRGTPNEENWPTFTDLPHATQVSFEIVPPVDLSKFLPNLPSSSLVGLFEPDSHFPPETVTPSPLDLVLRLLVYPPTRRLKPGQALKHPWFTTADDVPLVLPADCANYECGSSYGSSWMEHDLAHWLQQVMS